LSYIGAAIQNQKYTSKTNFCKEKAFFLKYLNCNA